MTEKEQRDNVKPLKTKDGLGWRRLTRITNHKLENFRRNLFRCETLDACPTLGLLIIN